jgi:hypothetical protein
MIQLRERALEVLQYLPQVSQELLGAVKSISQPRRWPTWWPASRNSS